MTTVIDIYDRVILFALVTHNSDYIIKHWPGRDSVLLFIERLRQEMRPPYLEINVLNKEDYKFHEQISQFGNKKFWKYLIITNSAFFIGKNQLFI